MLVFNSRIGYLGNDEEEKKTVDLSNDRCWSRTRWGSSEGMAIERYSGSDWTHRRLGFHPCPYHGHSNVRHSRTGTGDWTGSPKLKGT